ncbi:M48 family metallopeptidase [Verrucomicrobiota bacterium]
MIFEKLAGLRHSISNDEKAKHYENINNWFFLIRILLSAGILAAYQLSGASATLANGLRNSFGENWLLINGLYIIISIFGYTALMFPLSYYTEHVLEHHYELSNQTFGSWVSDFIKSLLIDLVLGLVFFEIIYTLLHFAPETWWFWATIFYIAFVIVLSTLFPTLIMPLFNKFEPLENNELTDKVNAMMQEAGINVVGVYKWGLEEKTSTGNAAFTGFGKTKRIILGDTLLKDYSDDQILSILAHEVGHYRNRDTTRLLVIGSLMAILGFWIAHTVLQYLVTRLGFDSAADIATMPLFLFALMVFSLITMPLSNGYSRKREYAADRYAVEKMSGAEGLTTALEKLAEQNLTDKEPNRIVEVLLHSHPSLNRRIAAAKSFAKTLR